MFEEIKSSLLNETVLSSIVYGGLVFEHKFKSIIQDHNSKFQTMTFLFLFADFLFEKKIFKVICLQIQHFIRSFRNWTPILTTFL